MNISDIVTADHVEIAPDTTVSQIQGTFDDPSIKAVIVKNDGVYTGIVTRRQIATSHHPPEEKARSLLRHVPKVDPDEDVREVARLMIESDARVLPVFEGQRMTGVVRADDLLERVEPFLDAAEVDDVYTRDLVTIDPETTFGMALHVLRRRRITHLPIVEDGSAVGILSLYDVTDIASRALQRSQGGDAGGTDAHGGAITDSAARARRGGFGAREGELERMLDLPVRDVMITPVRTTEPNRTLDEVLREMDAINGSSLVVVSEGDDPVGIVTKTDVLESLTWGTEGSRAVQIYGTDLMDDISYEDVVAMIDGFDEVDSDMRVFDSKVHLHEHDEKRRGVPLLLARIRLYTDRGMVIGSGEGYGAAHAIREARDVVERRIKDEKNYGQSKKHPGEDFWQRRFGWWLEIK